MVEETMIEGEVSESKEHKTTERGELKKIMQNIKRARGCRAR